MELIHAFSTIDVVLYTVAIAVPFSLLLIGKSAPRLSNNPSFGHVLSILVALVFVGLVFEVLFCIYLSNKGTDLITDVPIMALLAPFVFGVGTLWTATRIIPFSELRRFPLLRRVWSLLLLAAVMLVAFMVLKHTYWIIFSGIVGFLIVAFVGWILMRKLFNRVTGEAPPDGDPDLISEVISESKAEAARLAEQIARDEHVGKQP